MRYERDEAMSQGSRRSSSRPQQEIGVADPDRNSRPGWSSPAFYICRRKARQMMAAYPAEANRIGDKPPFAQEEGNGRLTGRVCDGMSL